MQGPYLPMFTAAQRRQIPAPGSGFGFGFDIDRLRHWLEDHIVWEGPSPESNAGRRARRNDGRLSEERVVVHRLSEAIDDGMPLR